MTKALSKETQYWVRTGQGRVWGPHTAVALERLRGQLTGACEVALDGKVFSPSVGFPELKELFTVQPPPVGPARERPPPPPPRITPAMLAAFGGLKQSKPPAEPPVASPQRGARIITPSPSVKVEVAAPAVSAPQVSAPPTPQPCPPPAACEELLQLPEEGDLSALSPVRLYALAALTSASGWLQLHLESGRMVQLSFRRGVPEHLASDDPELSLLRFLEQRGTITGAQGQLTSEHAEKTSLDPVSSLFALQLIPPSSAHELLGAHAQFLLDRALMSWRGSFSFERDAPPPPGSFPLGQRWTLLAEAIRRLDPAPLRTRLGERLSRPVQRSGGLALGRVEVLALNAQEARLYGSIDGTRTGEELLRQQDAAVAVRLLYLLHELGHLSFAAETLAAAEPRPSANVTEPQSPRQRPPAPARGPPPVIAAQSTVTLATGPADETPAAQLVRLRALRDRILPANHFEAMGLVRTASAAEVKRIFLLLARELHPDTVTDPSQQELRALKQALFARINEAAQSLSDDKRRKEYEAELDGKASQVDVARIFAAEESFRRAEIMIKARKYQEGLALIEEAIALNEEEAEFYAWRGYAKFLLASDRRLAYADCTADCRRALQLVERCLPGHLFLGHMAKAMGELRVAETAYHRVLELDPKHIEAQRELRLMGKK